MGERACAYDFPPDAVARRNSSRPSKNVNAAEADETVCGDEDATTGVQVSAPTREADRGWCGNGVTTPSC